MCSKIRSFCFFAQWASGLAAHSGMQRWLCRQLSQRKASPVKNSVRRSVIRLTAWWSMPGTVEQTRVQGEWSKKKIWPQQPPRNWSGCCSRTLILFRCRPVTALMKPLHPPSVPPERTNRHRSCCFPSTATQLQMAPLHPALSAIRQCRAGLGIRKAFTLRSCLPKECRLQEHLCVGAGESDTFIIWKTIRSNWWKAPTPRCVQSEALRC